MNILVSFALLSLFGAIGGQHLVPSALQLHRRSSRNLQVALDTLSRDRLPQNVARTGFNKLALLLLALTSTRSGFSAVGRITMSRSAPVMSLSAVLPQQSQMEFVEDFDPNVLISAADLAKLEAREVVAISNAIPEAFVDALIHDLEGLRETGLARSNQAALFGNGHWTFLWPKLDPSMGGDPSTREQLYAWADKLRIFLEQKYFHKYGLSLSDEKMELSYAHYPVGGWFHRHVDRSDTLGSTLERGAFKRALSFLLYLNKDWREEDGGKLRVYHTRDEDSTYDDYVPELGTLVMFQSDSIEHEVLSSNRTRMAIVGWFHESD